VPGRLVSVVTPTLNQARYLEATIRSIRAQTYPDIEHIVIDGGSTDGTLELLRRLAGDESLRWLTEPDDGMYDAINKGLALTTGEVLAYLNSDDAWMPWAVATVMRVFEARPEVELVFGDGLKVEEPSGVQRLRLFPPFDRQSLANHESLMQPAVFWRRSLFERIGGFDSAMRYVADLDYWLRAAEAGAAIAHVDEVIAIERIHEARLSSAQQDRMAAEDRGMRAKHAGVGAGSADRARAARRNSRWKRRLYRRFLGAWAARRFSRNLPWSTFLREGGLSVRWTRVMGGLVPRRGKRLSEAFVSRLATEILRGEDR
jgi:glycosyltransferase involved in cell wall biosynthesis